MVMAGMRIWAGDTLGRITDVTPFNTSWLLAVDAQGFESVKPVLGSMRDASQAKSSQLDPRAIVSSAASCWPRREAVAGQSGPTIGSEEGRPHLSHDEWSQQVSTNRKLYKPGQGRI